IRQSLNGLVVVRWPSLDSAAGSDGLEKAVLQKRVDVCSPAVLTYERSDGIGWLVLELLSVWLPEQTKVAVGFQPNTDRLFPRAASRICLAFPLRNVGRDLAKHRKSIPLLRRQAPLGIA